MNFSRLIHSAYLATINHPVLWLFGVFLTSGFNIHWLVAHNQTLERSGYVFGWLQGFGHQGPKTAEVVAIGFAVWIISIVLVSWAKILLVLHVATILKLKRVMPGFRRASDAVVPPLESGKLFGIQKNLVAESKRYIGRVSAISLITTLLTSLAAGVLFAPPLLWTRPGNQQAVLVILAIGVMLLIIFLISFQNIFGALFVIIYQRNLRDSLNLATDLIMSRWRVILAYVLLLMVIYGFALSAGVTLLGFGRNIFSLGIVPTASPPVFWGLMTLVMIGGLAILNTFFNIALLLLFNELVKSQPAEQEAKAVLEAV